MDAADAELFPSNSQPSPLRERGEPEKGKTAGGIFARAAMNAAHWQSCRFLFLKAEYFIKYDFYGLVYFTYYLINLTCSI